MDLISFAQIAVPVIAIGGSVYYDVRRLKRDLKTGFTDVGKELKAINVSINEINLALQENKLFDVFRSKEIKVIQDDIDRIQKKLNGL